MCFIQNDFTKLCIVVFTKVVYFFANTNVEQKAATPACCAKVRLRRPSHNKRFCKIGTRRCLKRHRSSQLRKAAATLAVSLKTTPK